MWYCLWSCASAHKCMLSNLLHISGSINYESVDLWWSDCCCCHWSHLTLCDLTKKTQKEVSFCTYLYCLLLKGIFFFFGSPLFLVLINYPLLGQFLNLKSRSRLTENLKLNTRDKVTCKVFKWNYLGHHGWKKLHDCDFGCDDCVNDVVPPAGKRRRKKKMMMNLTTLMSLQVTLINGFPPSYQGPQVLEILFIAWL